MILLDVGDGGDPNQEPHKKRYQFVNAICFLFPRFIGTWVLERYYSNMLSNTDSKLSFDDFPAIRDKQGFDSIQGFSYFWIMWTMVFGSRKSKLDVSVHKMLDQMDDVPILFLDALKGWYVMFQCDLHNQLICVSYENLQCPGITRLNITRRNTRNGLKTDRTVPSWRLIAIIGFRMKRLEIQRYCMKVLIRFLPNDKCGTGHFGHHKLENK